MSRSRTEIATILGLVVALVAATPASANMLLPLYLGPAILGIFTVIPVIAIEAFVVSRYVKRDWADTLRGVGLANLASLAAGFAVAWGFDRFYGQFAAAAGRGDFLGEVAKSLRGTEHPDPLADAIAVLLVHLTFFLASWLVEAPVMQRVLRLDSRMARRAALWANGCSYAILTALYFLL